MNKLVPLSVNNSRWAFAETWTGRPGEGAGPIEIIYGRWAYYLDGNHHGPAIRDEAGVYIDAETKRSCWSLLVLGRGGWVRSEGRRGFGLRLYRYRADGSNHSWDIGIVLRRSPCRPGSKYGPRTDGPAESIML